MIDYDPIAGDYARSRAVNPEVLKAVLTHCDPSAGNRVLEIGCGTGNYLSALDAATSWRLTGVEPSAGMIGRAAAKVETARLVRGTAEQTGLPDGAFDLVFSVDVAHHITDRPAWFREAARLLAPGGKILTVTDSNWIIRHRRPLSVYFPETVEQELARYPSITRLREEMTEAGFTDIREPRVEYPYRLTSLEAYRRKAFSALHLIPDDAFRNGIEAMARDLENGPIDCVSYYVLLWGVKAEWSA